MARDRADNDMVLGDDIVEDAVVDRWTVAMRPCPLEHREGLLHYVGGALGFGQLLQARGDPHCQFPADVVHRVRLTAKLLAAEPQVGAGRKADADWLGAGIGSRRSRLPSAVVQAVRPCSLSGVLGRPRAALPERGS